MAWIDPNRVLPTEDSVATAPSDEAAISTLRSIESQPEAVKPIFEIHQCDLTLGAKRCGISQNDAIGRIRKTNGNIKEAIRLTLHQ
jgi:hypothetical protein